MVAPTHCRSCIGSRRIEGHLTVTQVKPVLTVHFVALQDDPNVPEEPELSSLKKVKRGRSGPDYDVRNIYFFFIVERFLIFLQ